MKTRNSIFWLCILTVCAPAWAMEPEPQVTCPFRKLRLERAVATPPPIYPTHTLAAQGKFREALSQIETTVPSPGPDEVWDRLFRISGRSRLERIPTGPLAPADQRDFMKDLRARINKRINERKPIDSTHVMRFVHRAQMEAARNAEARLQAAAQTSPEERAYVERLYQSILARGQLLLDPGLRLAESERRSVIDANHAAAQALLRLAGTSFEGTKLDPINRNVQVGSLIHPDDRTPAGKLAATLATRYADHPFQLVLNAEVGGVLVTVDTSAIHINPNHLLNGFSDPHLQVSMRQMMAKARGQDRGQVSGFDVHYVAEDKQTYSPTTIFGNVDQIKLYARQAQKAKTREERDRIASEVGTTAHETGQHIEGMRRLSGHFLEATDRLRAGLRADSENGVHMEVVQGERGYLLFLPLTFDQEPYPGMPTFSLRMQEGEITSVGFFDAGRSFWITTFPPELKSAIDDLAKTLPPDGKVYDISPDQKLRLINVLNKIKRRAEVHAELSKPYEKTAKDVSDFAMHYLQEPSDESWEVLVSEMAKHGGAARNRTTLRQSGERAAVPKLDELGGFDRIPTAPYLKEKLQAAVNAGNRKARDTAVEATAMEAVIHYVDWMGWKWRDRGGDNVGYDIEIEDPKSGQKWFLEVKGIYDADEKTSFRVSANELRSAKSAERADKSILAAVTVAPDGATRVFFAARPALGGDLGAEPYRAYQLGQFLAQSELTDLRPPGMETVPTLVPEPGMSQLQQLEAVRAFLQELPAEQRAEMLRRFMQMTSKEAP